LIIILFFVSSVQADNKGWRLPFDGTHTITNGPGEGLHVNASSEAVDYAGTFSVVSPYDGHILDVTFVVDFGWVVRITHLDNTISFFAHMNGNSIVNWSPNDSVSQGQLVGTSSDSGGTNGNHLHFEARNGAAVGNVYSGQSLPVRAIPGQWWNHWYSPEPNFQADPNRISGAAEYPLSNVEPGGIPADGDPRHLANIVSPTGVPVAYLSNITNNQITFHMGGSPSTPNTNYETACQVGQYREGCGCWEAPFGSYTFDPTYTQIVNNTNQCTSSNQHCHRIWSRNDRNGWSAYRNLNFHTGNSTTRQPSIAISYYQSENTGELTYSSPNATRYYVYEDTPAAPPPTLIYNGPASSIRVNHQIDRSYTVIAWSPSHSWSPWSIWLVPNP